MSDLGRKRTLLTLQLLSMWRSAGEQNRQFAEVHAVSLLERNDAAPLFPDLSAMSDKEFVNYEAPPERLAFYQLHTEEGLKAFLYDVYWIG